MAEQVREFLAREPGGPVFLVGKSGGAGVVLQALEGLPEGSVERVVLLAPAVSPGYDLSRALRGVRRELVVFISPLDFALLGAGTWAFGTIDRVRGVGAGLVGFRVPGSEDRADRVEPYARVRHVRWRPSMAKVGYLGGHLAVDLPPFLRRYVVPMLRPGPVDLEAIVAGRSGSDSRG
jgi:pimeloyl-ACP methyl ester carboxylesterase